jgi:hypothetical protein
MRGIFLALALLSLFALQSGKPAHANGVYTLDYDSCTGGCGLNGQGTSNNNFGYVTLGQVSANQVSVMLDITDPGYIVHTGNGTNHAPFAFNTDMAITISNIADEYGTPSTFFTAGATNQALSGIGTFGYEIACTQNCPNGSNNGGAGPYLSFLVTANSGALSINDFIANANGFYFASDILGPGGVTGEVAANQAPTITTGGGTGVNGNVPEPASLTIMGAGLAMLGAVRRRRIQSRR